MRATEKWNIMAAAVIALYAHWIKYLYIQELCYNVHALVSKLSYIFILSLMWSIEVGIYGGP